VILEVYDRRVKVTAGMRRLIGVGLVAIAILVVLFDNWQFSATNAYTTLAGIETRFYAYALAVIGVGILIGGLVKLRR
jgi:hypothetical protein